jgi:hypothetical protein
MGAAIVVLVAVLSLWAVADEVGRRWGWADQLLHRALTWTPRDREVR